MTLRKLIPIVTNKYLVTTIAFLVWLTVFDKNNLINQLETYKDMKKLEKERAYFIEEIRKDKQTSSELKTNQRNLEKFAREKYMMKKDDEDIFLIIPEKKPEPVK